MVGLGLAPVRDGIPCEGLIPLAPLDCLNCCWLSGGECFVGDKPPREGGSGVAFSLSYLASRWFGVNCGCGAEGDDRQFRSREESAAPPPDVPPGKRDGGVVFSAPPSGDDSTEAGGGTARGLGFPPEVG